MSKLKNFAVAKMGIYGTKTYEDFDLHEIMKKPKSMIFHSASTLDLTDCCQGYDITPSNGAALDVITKEYEFNVAARSGYCGINKSVYDRHALQQGQKEDELKREN